MRVRSRGFIGAAAWPLLALLWAGCPQNPPVPGSKDDSSANAPRVDAITPNHGPAGGGTQVTIQGGPFESEIGVLFGSHAAVNPIIVNSRMITAITPPQAPATVDVTVLSDGGQTTVVGAFTYQAVDIISISPETGPNTGGTAVTITGENFSPSTLVKFDGEIAGSITVLNSRLITAVTPPHPAGWVRVQVLSDGTEDSLVPELDPQDPTDRLEGFRYDLPGVTITSVEPAFGPIEGGSQVTIRGTFFPEGVGVLIGGSAATGVTRLSDGLITAIVPPGTGAGAADVTIVYPGGQAVAPNAFEYTDGVMEDDGTDTDGDGLTDVQEMTGWEVWVEQFGLQLGVDTFGNVTRYTATGDPENADTDGDGLGDRVEFLIRCDPRMRDCDGDGLWDGEEWNQWLTSPTSVDTDADARGDRNLQNAPNQALFDGMELYDTEALRFPPGDPQRIVRTRGTSPTLSDTDGDGVSDFDEFDSTVRNGVISDLPQLEYRLVGDVDVRLNVQYAETVGESNEYGVTLTESQTDTVASEFSNTFGWSVEIGAEYGYSGASAHVVGLFTAGVHGEYTWTNSTESSKESSKESSRVQTDSREMTESAAEGGIRTSILLANSGNTTFTLTGLGVLVSQREMRRAGGDVSPDRGVKPITTMTPVFDSVTLAPGESAGPFELAATGINAQAIKELLAAPDTLMLGTAAMNFTDSNGLDFDYVRQFTVAQTAHLVIDFGDGEVRQYNVATNVDRNPDSTYRGIKVGAVFQDILGLPFGDPANGYTTMQDESGRQVLQHLLGRRFSARADGSRRNYWFTGTSNPQHTTVDFTEIVLRAGDYLHIFFNRDDDDDGLSNTLERSAGTDQGPAGPDADGDSLTDRFEVLEGWIAFENPLDPNEAHPDGFEKRRVYSSPTAADTDGDGLVDGQEFATRCDPLDPDSDGDGLLDGQDPIPARRAGIRFVKSDAIPGGNGRTWATAYTTIQRALLDAAGNPHANPADDVSQIWVARGTYRPSSRNSPIVMVNSVGIFGGFSGPDAVTGFTGETKRGQRNSNAFTNGCLISGDMASPPNDVGAINLDSPGTYSDNCPVIISAPASVSSSATLDGFMITGAYAQTADSLSGAVYAAGSPVIQNCLIIRNGNQRNGGGIRTDFASSPTLKKCILANNIANAGGGAYLASTGQVVVEDCEFSQNEARRRGTGIELQSKGGGLYISSGTGGRVEVRRCAFTGNQAWNNGGGANAAGLGYARFDACRFNSNATLIPTQGGTPRGDGGGLNMDIDGSVSSSTFWDNVSSANGGGISVLNGDGSGTVPHRVAITNCTVAHNRVLPGGYDGGGIAVIGAPCSVDVANTIAWQNFQGTTPPDSANNPERWQILVGNGAAVSVRNSCLNGPPQLFGGNGNIFTDPTLLEHELGDFQLDRRSPCIDRGSTFVDLDPLLPGLQPLPQFDIFGNPRIVDGNGDGIVAVDIGANEALAQQD